MEGVEVEVPYGRCEQINNTKSWNESEGEFEQHDEFRVNTSSIE